MCGRVSPSEMSHGTTRRRSQSARGIWYGGIPLCKEVTLRPLSYNRQCSLAGMGWGPAGNCCRRVWLPAVLGTRMYKPGNYSFPQDMYKDKSAWCQSSAHHRPDKHCFCGNQINKSCDLRAGQCAPRRSEGLCEAVLRLSEGLALILHRYD